MRRFLIGAAIAYLIVLLIGWWMIHYDDGSNWMVTLFLFSPRWVAAVPMALLLPLTMLCCFRWSLLYVAHVAVIVIPILGLQIPRGSDAESASAKLRVMTCNLGGGHIWRNEIVQLVRDENIEVLLLQECATSVSIPLFEELGWNHRQQHNMAIGSVHGLDEPVIIARQPKENYEVAAAITCRLHLVDTVDEDSPAIRLSSTASEIDRQQSINLVCLHLPTFRPAMQRAREFDPATGQAIVEMGKKYSAIAGQAHERVTQMTGPTIIAGDFNVPIESVYYRGYWSDYRNAQSDAGLGLGYTKFTSIHGVRIDHVLVNDDFSVIRSRVGTDFGGDHRPVIVELQRR